MKQVTRCYNCKDIIRLAGSFKAEIKEPSIINGVEFPDMVVKKSISLCRECAGKAGYKVKEKGGDNNVRRKESKA